jgi:hypothetical protein
MQAKDYLSATTLSKKTAATLDLLESGETQKLIISALKTLLWRQT